MPSSKWYRQKPDVMKSAYAMEKMWNNYSGYLMLGSATALSILIVVKMFQGVMYERRLHATEYARESSK
ncbi:MAG: hypothetical protein SFH39_00565 [Candidatus Magnetobacterium sp. LHC-1]